MLLKLPILLAIGILPLVRAGWDDFANNLATDLAPFLSLFGEQMTKQYLSECTTALDYFIFAMGPMGIITAVVSAIRVCGSPSLRAFIGRAQEGRGNAEAELCSSTSRDVCELYNNGGIARVFGRPKILEVIYDPDQAESETAGISTFQEYLGGKGNTKWHRYHSKDERVLNKDDAESSVSIEKKPPRTAFSPNLSLNIGIKKQPPIVFWAVGLGGLALQCGVLVFAGISTYYLEWEKEGRRPDSYACPLVLVGSVMLCLGMFLCAFVVGQSTDEEVWHRDKTCINNASVYWLQPGGQIVGDQTFDAFSYSEDRLEMYTTSWKSRSNESELMVWAAISITLCGFVLQFTGLRGIHSAVSIAQLGVTMIMSAARSALRMQRLKANANEFAEYPDEVLGHELDWLALRIGRNIIEESIKQEKSCHVRSSDIPSLPRTGSSRHRHFWKLCGRSRQSGGTNRLQKGHSPSSSHLNVASKVLGYRTRLAQLTSSPTISSRHFKDEMVEVRHRARQLAEAMESAMNVVFSKAKIKHEWEKAESTWWGITCKVSMAPGSFSEYRLNDKDDKDLAQNENMIYLQLQRPDYLNNSTATWILKDRLEIEGLLGLWLWSLKSDPKVEVEDPQTHLRTSRASEIPLRRIISSDQSTAQTQFRMWWPSQTNYNITKHVLPHELRNAGDASQILTITDKSSNTSSNSSGTVESGDTKETLWIPLKPTVADSNWIRAEAFRQRLIRFFGWHTANLSKDEEQFTVWSASTRSPLLSLCVQDVFGSFIQSLLGVVDDIGEVQIEESQTSLCLKNTLVSDIIDIFMEKGLGPRDDALLCIVPSMLATSSGSRARMPSAATALAAARKSANESRRRKNWDKSEAVLKWVWEICNKHQHADTNVVNEACIALGELYRYALADEDSRQFGLRGIEWLTKSGRSRSPSPEVSTIIDRYERIAKDFAGPAANQVDDRSLPGIEYENLDLTKTLMRLTWPKSIRNEDKGPAMCLAASRGWIEVVLAFLELPGMHPDFKDSDCRTALSHAAEAGCVDAIKELLDWGAFPNSEDISHRTPLSYAASKGQYSVMEMLLRDPRVSPDAQDKEGRTPLWWAAGSGEEAAVELLLATNQVDTEAHKDLPGGTPLLHAASLGHDAVVKLLLARHTLNTNARDDQGRTSLSCATQHGHEAVVELLLADDRVDPDVMDRNQETPILLATRFCREAIAQKLIATEKVNLEVTYRQEARPNETWRTPLHWAAASGQEAVVTALIATNKVDLDLPAANRQTALSFAAEAGHEAVVNLLLATDKVDVEGKQGRTPLSYATYEGHETIVRLLLATEKASPASRDLQGETPLHKAAQRGWDSIVELLLATGAVDIEIQDKWGKTPLCHAAAAGHANTVRLLLAVGKVDPNNRYDHGSTLLHMAAERGQDAVVELLLAIGGVNVESTDYDGDTPLHIAARSGHNAVVRLLLGSRRVDLTIENTAKCTPLLLAIRQGRDTVVELLLATGGINVNAGNTYGETPLSWAVEHRKRKIVKILKSYGARPRRDSKSSISSTESGWSVY